MAVQRAHRHPLPSAKLASSHPARPIQTCQPLYLSSAATTNHCSKLSAHKQSSSQILSSKKVHSSDAYSRKGTLVQINFAQKLSTTRQSAIGIHRGSLFFALG